MTIFSCWFAVGEFVNVDELEEEYQVLANNSLVLQRPSSHHEGWFRCTAANEGYYILHGSLNALQNTVLDFANNFLQDELRWFIKIYVRSF